MKLVLTTQGVGQSEGVEAHIHRWLEKLARICPRAVEVRVHLGLDHGRNMVDHYKCAVRVSVPGPDLYAEDVHSTVHGAIDLAFEKIQDQAKCRREKSTVGRHTAAARAKRRAQDQQME